MRIVLLIVTAAALLQGCSLTQKAKDIWQGPPPAFQAQNAYTTGTLNDAIERVLILPLFYDSDNSPDLKFLDAVFASELNKTLLFEVVPISRDALKKYAGREHLASIDLLPGNLLHTLKKAYGAQAIIFTDLTHYDPYRPIAFGLRCKLADLDNGNVIWAFDQVFDAGDPRVAQAAMSFFEQLNTNPYPLNRAESILQSPQRFSRYVAFATFQTLPQRPTRYLEVGQAPPSAAQLGVATSTMVSSHAKRK